MSVDIAWFEPSGRPMGEEAWSAGFKQCFGMRMLGDMIATSTSAARRSGRFDAGFDHAFHEAIPFKIPGPFRGQRWQRLFDTARPDDEQSWFPSGKAYDLQGRSMALFRTVPKPAMLEQQNPSRRASAAPDAPPRDDTTEPQTGEPEMTATPAADSAVAEETH